MLIKTKLANKIRVSCNQERHGFTWTDTVYMYSVTMLSVRLLNKQQLPLPTQSNIPSAEYTNEVLTLNLTLIPLVKCSVGLFG